jgi:hypothetical protein
LREHFRRLLDPTLLLLVVVSAVGLRLALAAGLFGLPLALLVVSWLFKYAYALLEDVAHGITKPRVLSLEMVNPVEQRPLVQLFLCGLAVMAVRYVGGPAGAVLGAVLAAVLPASVAILGASGNVFQAINPLALRCVVHALGRYYLIILASVATVAAGLWGLVAASAPLTVQMAFALFAVLAVFNVIGGALYERRAMLDIATVHSPEQALEREERSRLRERSRVIDELYVLARARRYQELGPPLERWLAGLDAEQLAADARALVAAPRSWNDTRAVGLIARRVIARLRAVRLDTDALDAFESALDGDATFQVGCGVEALDLAELAAAAGRRPLARRILESCAATDLDDYEAKRLELLRARFAR